MKALLATVALAFSAPALAQTPAFDAQPVLKANGFKGFALIAKGDAIVWQTPRGSCAPSDDPNVVVLCHPRDPAFMLWPWASVTKQVIALLAMTEVDRGRLSLDAPASRYLNALGPTKSAPTLRQLLQHRAGLRNPDDSPKGSDESPDWYTTGPTGLGWCLKGRKAAGGNWRYNNCDTIVIGAILEKLTGKSVPTLFEERIAKPLAMEATSFVTVPLGKSPTFPAVQIAPQEYATLTRFGAAGGLIGPALDLLKFDRALLTGKLVSPASRAAMWDGDPKLGYMGLAQWAFDAPLKGCVDPVRLIERRGGIGRFQVRNILIPERDMTVILFTADAEQEFGEVWQGKGLSHDLLSAAACPTGAL